jgi:hypothetical protein
VLELEFLAVVADIVLGEDKLKMNENALIKNVLTEEQQRLITLSASRRLAMPEFKIKNFVGNAQITPYAKLRQYIIELNSREAAVKQMEFDKRKVELEIELEQEKAEQAQGQSVAQYKLHQLEIQRLTGVLEKNKLNYRDAVQERDIFLKVIEEFNNSSEAYLPDGRRLIDVFDDPETTEQLEKEYWTLRLAKQTALDMIAYGRAGVGNMEAVTMLEPAQQLEVMQIACDFFVRNEIRNNNLLSAINQSVQEQQLSNNALSKQLVFDFGDNNVPGL